MFFASFFGSIIRLLVAHACDYGPCRHGKCPALWHASTPREASCVCFCLVFFVCFCLFCCFFVSVCCNVVCFWFFFVVCVVCVCCVFCVCFFRVFGYKSMHRKVFGSTEARKQERKETRKQESKKAREQGSKGTRKQASPRAQDDPKMAPKYKIVEPKETPRGFENESSRRPR